MSLNAVHEVARHFSWFPPRGPGLGSSLLMSNRESELVSLWLRISTVFDTPLSLAIPKFFIQLSFWFSSSVNSLFHWNIPQPNPSSSSWLFYLDPPLCFTEVNYSFFSLRSMSHGHQVIQITLNVLVKRLLLFDSLKKSGILHL